MLPKGISHTKIYSAWRNMNKRCKNASYVHFANYGGRGISITPAWDKFENFYNDMRETYFDGAEIDRIDCNGDYAPDNCRWVTKTVQQNNTNKVANAKGYYKKDGKYRAQISINGKTKNLGIYESAGEAHQAYLNAKSFKLNYLNL